MPLIYVMNIYTILKTEAETETTHTINTINIYIFISLLIINKNLCN